MLSTMSRRDPGPDSTQVVPLALHACRTVKGTAKAKARPSRGDSAAAGGKKPKAKGKVKPSQKKK